MKDKIKKGSENEVYNTLFMSLYSPKEKRKLLLYSLKNSLILQEEYENLLEIRAKKKAVLKEIKSEFALINKDYQNLKKILPNVKSILAYTEKELDFLDVEIKNLKKSIKTEKEEIELNSELRSKLKPLERDIKRSIQISKKKDKLKEEIVKKKSKPISKADRIKNNLKIIENKLNKL